MTARFACPEPLCAQIESLRRSAGAGMVVRRGDGARDLLVMSEIRGAMPVGAWMRFPEVLDSPGISVGSTLARQAMNRMHELGELAREYRGRNKAMLWCRVR